MAGSELKSRIQDEMKSALRAGDKERLGVIRLILAAIKQIEVDTRLELDDAAILAVLDKMVKQRRESIVQFRAGAREDLAVKEEFEISIIQGYLPEPLGEAEITSLIDKAIQESGAVSVKDMGKVMGLLKPQLQGRADIGAVSGLVKTRLAG